MPAGPKVAGSPADERIPADERSPASKSQPNLQHPQPGLQAPHVQAQLQVQVKLVCHCHQPASVLDPWAARYDTWLLIKLTPKDVVFSFSFFLSFLSFPFLLCLIHNIACG